MFHGNTAAEPLVFPHPVEAKEKDHTYKLRDFNLNTNCAEILFNFYAT
jgi:hypothetical protein